MQKFITPNPIVLPFITVHFLTEMSTEIIKSLDDIPHTRLMLVNLHTAEKVDLYLRFDLKSFKIRALHADRAKDLLNEEIRKAINDVNYTVSEGRPDEAIYRNEVFDILSHPSSLRLPDEKPSTSAEIMTSLWKVIGQLANDNEMRSYEQLSSFGRYVDSNNEMVYGIRIYLGNFITAWFFKPIDDVPYRQQAHEGELAGSAHVMGKSGYRFRIGHSMWHDRSHRAWMPFIPHGEIIQRVQKGVKMIFGELPLAETDLAGIVSDMVFDK